MGMNTLYAFVFINWLSSLKICDFLLFSLLIFTKKNVQLMASITILQINIKFFQQNFWRDAGKTYQQKNGHP